MRGLYIHIPFCKKVCTYCDFTKRVPKNKEMIKEYITNLIEELHSYNKYFDSIETIYIGGGTPTLLDNYELERLLKELVIFKNIKEFSIEINPETIDLKKALLLKKYGVNRVSVGVESFDDKILKTLGRSHDKNTAIKAIDILKNAGFTNINIDLIFAAPGSDISSIKNDLKVFYKLDINHLSYYSLILEENTILDYQVRNKIVSMLDNEIEANMYEYIIEDLSKNGFIQYEISNFTNNNAESIHNKLYWENKEYIGIGLGASGYLDGVRYTNNKHLNEYYKEYKNISETIDFNEKLKEEMILGLRMLKGININEVNEKYNINLLDKFSEINSLINDNLLEITNGYLHLTKKGLLVGNDVFVIFI